MHTPRWSYAASFGSFLKAIPRTNRAKGDFHISVEARFPLNESDLQNPISYQIFAKDTRTTEHRIDLHERLQTPR